ncbi:lipase 1 [Nannizzia gypsea CBS 118893]|uniref:Lipase 1 n=1 Tax=Arthroderma gypseum (strain ATCC MYA-4604 / CBS 118893) TaxID=535722 RepID=E4V450_ARTGP|nr:lipase 1 [Nannizzia gypsea CBS 118893]EFR04774.1 lipase 1 [Nannizzia gypsea CBS 118893]
MVIFIKLWLSLVIFTLAAQALPSGPDLRGSVPLPSEDPFYQPPLGYECARPGTILKQRKVPNPIAALGKIPVSLKSAHHVMYRTSDSFSNATVAVTTILVPENADHSKLLSFQVAEDASSPNCGVSYAVQSGHQVGPKYGTVVTQTEFLLIIAALKSGWVVTAPDFEGLEGSWLANYRAGYAVLDGIRAALASGYFTGVAQDAVVTMWGYSGGSLASGFAAELQPCYAPELKIAGAALGGTIPKVKTVVQSTNKSVWAGLLPAGIYGLSKDYPLVNLVIENGLKPEKKKDFLRVADQCFVANILDFAYEDIFKYLQDPGAFDRPELADIIEKNSMGKRIPRIPLFVYKAEKDEVSPVEETNDLVEYYCNNDAIVHYNRDLKTNHLILALTGAPGALNWLADRFEGKPIGTKCKVTEEFMSLSDPRANRVMSLRLISEFLVMLSRVINGPTNLTRTR